MKKLTIILLTFSFFMACQSGQQPTADKPEAAAEQYRPLFHFTPPAKWMNDPNGMVFYEGEYHLFYQHYPEDIVWGPMHWGHAVSRDLLTWEHLPIALYPDSLGYIFSGSAVVDWKNTSGFGVDGEPPLIAIFTHHDPVGEKAGRNDFQYQSIAYSNDKGRTWTKYEGNPVVPNPGIRDFRDPKVIWDEDSQQWVMVFAAWDHVTFYGSPNLKDWEHLSDFGREWGTHAGVWECPDLFPMTLEDGGKKQWVLLVSLNPGGPNGGSGTQYFVGNFDGKSFTLDEGFAQNFGKIPAHVPDGEVFADFENGYGDWNTEGEAFGTKPANGSLSKQMDITGFSGKAFVNSYYGGDQATGKLISPNFTIGRSFINFQIGGGNDKLRTAINLVVDGQSVRSASGSNGEQLKWTGWDVSDLKGKTAHLEIVDTHTGGWGHINLDQIIFADELAIPAKDKAVWLDWGRDNYAGVTFSDVPGDRRIFIGWMSNWDYAQVVPTESWRSAMTLPRDLVLKNSDKGLLLVSLPSGELQKLRGKSFLLENQSLTGELDLTDKLVFSPAASEMELEIELQDGGATDFGIALSNSKGEEYRIGFDAASKQFYSDRTKAGDASFSTVFAANRHLAQRISDDKTIRFHLFFDVASCELFADGGEVVMTDIFFPEEVFSQLKIYSINGAVQVKGGQIYEMEE
ncbi:MAG TPA: glycoside hydrolase family 32 protein [Saprospiraceae bacterium]|nr:glycoside hydrolase family 32 protein [Saprospiraceae bacterium]HMQ84657.1 glycoside hydrolase family 32 protein [Saprospiraceae bacterium]